MYQDIQLRIKECDIEIEKMLNEQINSNDDKCQHSLDRKAHKRINKNAPKNIDINLLSYQYFEGVDLLAIEGVSHSVVLTLMSEIGLEGLKKFETAKQFASWLRLSPNNKISGGKVLSSKIAKGRVSAISATARKLAVIIWNMVIKRLPYNNEHGSMNFWIKKEKEKYSK
jgi:transposase